MVWECSLNFGAYSWLPKNSSGVFSEIGCSKWCWLIESGNLADCFYRTLTLWKSFKFFNAERNRVYVDDETKSSCCESCSKHWEILRRKDWIFCSRGEKRDKTFTSWTCSIKLPILDHMHCCITKLLSCFHLRFLKFHQIHLLGENKVKIRIGMGRAWIYTYLDRFLSYPQVKRVSWLKRTTVFFSMDEFVWWNFEITTPQTWHFSAPGKC